MPKSDSRAFRGPKAGKSAYFTHPDFSAAKLEKKKCAQTTRVNTVHGNELADRLAKEAARNKGTKTAFNRIPKLRYYNEIAEETKQKL
jgi:hypothetical protein